MISSKLVDWVNRVVVVRKENNKYKFFIKHQIYGLVECLLDDA